jgi:hypothetical protein
MSDTDEPTPTPGKKNYGFDVGFTIINPYFTVVFLVFFGIGLLRLIWWLCKLYHHNLAEIAFQVGDQFGLILLSAEHLERIGVFEATDTDILQDQDSGGIECSICLSTLTPGDMCRRLPTPCNHVFHQVCIDVWFQKSSRCPNCKRSIYLILEEIDEPGDDNELLHADPEAEAVREGAVTDSTDPARGHYTPLDPAPHRGTAV